VADNLGFPCRNKRGYDETQVPETMDEECFIVTAEREPVHPVYAVVVSWTLFPDRDA
jgi:hypothetical protein